MALTVAMKLNMATLEELTGDDLNANTQILHNGYDINKAFSASTTPDVDTAAFQTKLMSGGAGTIDLTSLLLNGVAVSASGKKPRGLLITALSGNSGNVTVVKGASNGYTGLGSAFSITLEPGMSVAVDFASGGNAVGSGDKTLDLSGTGTDGVRFSFVAGT